MCVCVCEGGRAEGGGHHSYLLFHELIITLCTIFPRLTDRTPEALSFVYRSRKKCMRFAVSFVIDCFYLFEGASQRGRKKRKSTKKRFGLLGFTPKLFLYS